jgi:hypothetical protein
MMYGVIDETFIEKFKLLIEEGAGRSSDAGGAAAGAARRLDGLGGVHGGLHYSGRPVVVDRKGGDDVLRCSENELGFFRLIIW